MQCYKMYYTVTLEYENWLQKSIALWIQKLNNNDES